MQARRKGQKRTRKAVRLRCTATAISHARSDEMHTLRAHVPRLLPACRRTGEVKHEIETPFTPCGQSRCVCSWLQCDSYACDVCYTVPVPPSMAMRHSWLQSNVTAAAFPVAWSQSLPDRPATPDGSLLPPGARIHLTGPTTPRTARSNSTRRAGWLLLKGPAAVPWAWAIDSSCGPRSSCCTRSVYRTDVVAPVSSTIVTSCPRRLARMNGVWSWATCRLSATRAGASARWWHQLGQRAAWMAAHATCLSPGAGLQLLQQPQPRSVTLCQVPALHRARYRQLPASTRTAGIGCCPGRTCCRIGRTHWCRRSPSELCCDT